MNPRKRKTASRESVKPKKGAKPAKKAAPIEAEAQLTAAPLAGVAASGVTDHIAINRANFDGSMDAVLNAVIWRNANNRKLVSHSVASSQVTLLFQ